MTDISNQEVANEQGKTGMGKVGAAILSGIFCSYVMNQASLHGVNFQLLGVPSEAVKSTIDGTMTGLLVGLTPTHFVASITDAIIFVKTTAKQWKQAWVNN